jgi:hypothetical protein
MPNTRRLSTHEFHRIGILLLWHQTRSGGDRVTQFEETEFAGAVENDVFRQRDRCIMIIAARSRTRLRSRDR